jgi:hypothetical protein
MRGEEEWRMARDREPSRREDRAARRHPKMSLAPWDNSGLRDRLGGAEAAIEEARGSVEFELCEVARRRDGECGKRRRRRGGTSGS